LKRALSTTAREMLKSKGRTTAQIQKIAPLSAPPPAWRGMPTRGNVRTFALLIEFQDYAHANSQNVINNMLFGAGVAANAPYESMASYYTRSSYGLLNLSNGNTLGWYRTAYNRSSVAQDGTGRDNLIKEALNYFDSQGHNFSQYDADNDGTIDYFLVFWTGPDTGWGSFWWGYQPTFGDNNYTLDGVKLGKYSWQWESNSPITAIHETGHALGLPDYYDYDPEFGPDGGVGRFDMMDHNMGDHNCFSKWVLDWLTPSVVATCSENLTLSASGTAQDAVLIGPGIDTDDIFSEYFMVQNRHRVGNDTGMPGDGMLIWHLDATLDASGNDFANDNSYTCHKLLRLMEADGLEEIDCNGRMNAGDYYKAGISFGPKTTPSNRKYDRSDSGVSVTGFSNPGLQMSADFGVPDVLENYAYVTKVQVGEDNYLYINVKGNFSQVHGCSGPWFARSKFPITDERTKEQMGIAISSLSRKRMVHVWTNCCANGYPIMTGIQSYQQ
jgi:M6 family metalloprotease-like protein